MMRRFIPSLSALVAFEAAATYRSFTRAGDDLGLTQSGISRQVSSLETKLGLKLFERIGPRLVLTNEGRSYVTIVTRILNDLEEASIDLVRGSTSKDTLQIGVQDSLASQWLVPRMKGFVARFPDTNFNMVPITSDIDFEAANIDVALLRGRGAWEDAHAFHLMSEAVAVVAAPSLIPKGANIALKDYHTYPMIQNAHRPDSWLHWLDVKGLARSKNINGPRFAQTSMVIEAARAGMGLAILPTLMITEQLIDGSLHMPFGPEISSGLSYFVVYPLKQGVSKPVLDFRDWSIAEARKVT